MSNKVLSYIKFGEIAEFRNGLNFNKNNHGSGCKLIGVADFQNNFTPNYDSLEEVNPEGITKADDFLKKDDIIFVRSNGNKTLVGRSLYIDRDIQALFSGFCIRARIATDLIDPLFLAYYTRTKHFKSSISFIAGTNINNLNQTILSQVNIPLFPKSIQTSILNILISIDKKINLNKSKIEELEKIAKTIFEYWFVQFDFPDVNGKPYKSSGGQLIWNESLKRKIPIGWKIAKLSSIADIKRGSLITEQTANSNGKIKVIAAGLEYSYLHDQPNRPENTITVSSSGASAGYINLWREPIFASDCITIRGKNDTMTFYIWGYLNLVKKYILQQAKGSAQPHVYPTDLNDLCWVIPDQNTLNLFSKLILDSNKRIALLINENQSLSELRDWLLPMLMNGQISIKPQLEHVNNKLNINQLGFEEVI